MAREYNPNDIERHFRHENVWVSIPEQSKRTGLKIVQSEMPERWDLPDNDDNFTLSRRVINFEVRDGDGELVKQFDSESPMELRVGLTQLEVRRQTELGNVKLAYAVSKEEPWVVLEDLEFDPAARDVVVQITQWGDPGVGVGR